MNKLSNAKRTQIVAALVEGMSVRAVCRMTGAAKGTVLKLLAELGYACWKYQDATLRDLPCKRVQCDEIWSFCCAKQKNVPLAKAAPEFAGDVWTWTAICADTTLVPSFMALNPPPGVESSAAAPQGLGRRVLGLRSGDRIRPWVSTLAVPLLVGGRVAA